MDGRIILTSRSWFPSQSLPEGIYELMQGYLKYGATFKVSLVRSSIYVELTGGFAETFSDLSVRCVAGRGIRVLMRVGSL
jgi:hypothetical protein